MFEFEWHEAPGVRDPVLAATWARLGIRVGKNFASEMIDTRSSSRRTGIYGSLFPLAEWLIEHWWHLFHEPSPMSPIPAGRAAKPWLRPWVQRHNLLAARDGGALPDLSFVRDAEEIVVKWTPDPGSESATAVRFISGGVVRLAVEDFERAVGAIVNAVLIRLADQVGDNEDASRLNEAWQAIQNADLDETELCRLLALLGVDPYDPTEATDELLGVIDRGLRAVPAPLVRDLCGGTTPDLLSKGLDWLLREQNNLCDTCDGQKARTITPEVAFSAHETGYRAARKVRSELLCVAPDEPLLKLEELLVGCLGWTESCFRKTQEVENIDGLVGIDRETVAPILVAPGTRSRAGERFRLARAAYFSATGGLGESPHLLTSSTTRPERTARAFAAELLAPAVALRTRISGRLGDREVEALAADFEVSEWVISHQIENHGIGSVGS